jgi:hypothetical protein
MRMSSVRCDREEQQSALSIQPTARRDFACPLPLGYASFTSATRLNIQPASVLSKSGKLPVSLRLSSKRLSI